jgi:hypothetical protein
MIPEDARASLGVSSEWFRLSVRVDVGTQRFTMYSLLHRTSSGAVTPVLRNFADE